MLSLVFTPERYDDVKRHPAIVPEAFAVILVALRTPEMVALLAEIRVVVMRPEEYNIVLVDDIFVGPIVQPPIVPPEAFSLFVTIRPDE